MYHIKDWPSGNLDVYRKNASFNWKLMRLQLYSEEKLKLMNEAYDYLQTQPLYEISEENGNFEEKRRQTLLRTFELLKHPLFNSENSPENMQKNTIVTTVLGMYDFSLVARHGLLNNFALFGILGLGTDRHFYMMEKLINIEVGFAFCLTEISHGTNTKGLRTEARYDPSSQCFILNTPDFEAAKCWAGNLGKTATHGLVFAQLYTPDGKCHGLHCFIVPIRDPLTMKTYPGLSVMDMGPKIGFNGIDNGVLLLHNYSIPRENLLNRTGDVSPEGEYTSSFKDQSKRFGASLGNLSAGRVSICYFGVINMIKALTIAIRYGHIRRQFGSGKKESPIIEYPLHQFRLFPYLAALYPLHVFGVRLNDHFIEFLQLRMIGSDPEKTAKYGQEIHALSSSGKAISGWIARDAIQECREACGGHGYLEASGFGYLRDDNDANCTYEGDNNVILQQTSNWLLGLWKKRHGSSLDFPMKTVSFMKNSHLLFNKEWTLDTYSMAKNDSQVFDATLENYKWLICYLCAASSNDLEKLNEKFDAFTSRNNNQIYRAHSLSLAYIEYVMLLWFKEKIVEFDRSLQPVLRKLGALFALTRLLKHSNLLTEGGICLRAGKAMSNIHSHIRRLISELLPDSLCLIEAFSPPDFFLRSVIGTADGKVYEHLQQSMMTAPGAMERDKYWREMSYNKKSSKL